MNNKEFMHSMRKGNIHISNSSVNGYGMIKSSFLQSCLHKDRCYNLKTDFNVQLGVLRIFIKFAALFLSKKACFTVGKNQSSYFLKKQQGLGKGILQRGGNK